MEGHYSEDLKEKDQAYKICEEKKETATHSSVLAWRIPGPSTSFMGLFKEFVYKSSLSISPSMETHSSILAWRIPGMEEPGGLPSMGLHRVRHD